MERETVSMLCNPYTRGTLRLVEASNSDGIRTEFLEDVQTGEKFPFHNGIPVLYDASRLEGYNLQYNEFYRRTARFYDPALKTLAVLTGGRESKFRKQFLRLLELRQDSKVLEVSVGTGTKIAAPNITLGDFRRYAQCQKYKINSNCSIKRRELNFARCSMVFHVGG